MKIKEARKIVGDIDSVEPFLIPEEDSDPMGVYKVQPVILMRLRYWPSIIQTSTRSLIG